jgi:para-nitrobenzyl esterase
MLADSFLSGLSEEDLSIYPEMSRIDLSRRYFAEGMFLTSTRFMAKNMARVNSPGYLYHYAYVPESRAGQIPGAPHGAEVTLIFGTAIEHPEFVRPRDTILTAKDIDVANTMRAYWLNFARTGDPNGEGLPDWPVYNVQTDQALLVDQTIRAEPELNRELLDFHESNALARRARWQATK